MINRTIIIITCIVALIFIILFLSGFFMEHKSYIALDAEGINFFMTHREGIKDFQCETQPILNNDPVSHYFCTIVYQKGGKYE